MTSLPPELRIANADAVLHGPRGQVTQRAHCLGLSRQALYRDTQAVLQTLDGRDCRQQLQQLRDEVAALHRRVAELQNLRDDAFLLDDDRCAAFASTAQAEGVSLPMCHRLLAVLMDKPAVEQQAQKRQPPSVAQLGRLTQEAGRRSSALLTVLDDFSRPRVEQTAADEIFFGKKPCLMAVAQHSLCWVSGRLAESRSGVEWAKEFRRLPRLLQTTQDGGSGLAKGLDIVNQERRQNDQAKVVAQDDHFHVLREGTRVLRKMQGDVSRLVDNADKLDRKMSLSGAVGAQAVAGVRGVLCGVWRASSLVECLNSVARMQQSRHRKMTQGLLDLKRLYWNCREFRTGHRWRKSPYDLNGSQLPTRDWWELSRWTPQQLRQHLQGTNATAAETLPQKVSGLEVAA